MVLIIQICYDVTRQQTMELTPTNIRVIASIGDLTSVYLQVCADRASRQEISAKWLAYWCLINYTGLHKIPDKLVLF